MNKGLIPGLTFAAAFVLAPASAFATDVQGTAPEARSETAVAASAVEGAPTDAPTVVFLTREEHEKASARRALARPSPNMSWHGGEIMVSSVVESIFWGPSWNSGSFSGDKVTGLDTFYGGFGGSNYAGTNTEYTGSNGRVSRVSAFGGHHLDFTTATGGSKTAPILAEVCKLITNPVANGYYPVYTDVPRGRARFCAWHSWGSCGSPAVPVQFAFFFNLDGDAGCDPDDQTTAHSQGLAALANVSGHELSEAMTDPRGSGWFDSSGAENADKCAWTFGADVLTLSNGSQFKIQGNWSNAAYNAVPQGGYTKGGCIGTQ
ncbi:MAG TPA: hypothetical protein VLJ18_03235 [Thermoanaerobaculia bacterium]|nr:hypothetical protein [Thermoanaerobaculia bacterium]